MSLIDHGVVTLEIRAPVQPDDRVVLDQGVAERRCRDRPTGEADHDDAAFEANHLGRRVISGSAHGIEHDVDASGSDDRLDRRDEVNRRPVDHVVRAGLRYGRHLFGATHHRDHGGAERLAHLNRGQADATSGRMHQEGLTGQESCPADKPDVCRLVADREGGCLSVIQGLRRREDRRTGDQRPLCETTVRGCRQPDHTVTDGHLLDTCSNLDHRAAHLDARDEGQWWPHLVVPTRHQDVSEVQGGGGDIHQDVAGLDRRRFCINQTHHLDRLAQTGDLPGTHHHHGRITTSTPRRCLAGTCSAVASP